MAVTDAMDALAVTVVSFVRERLAVIVQPSATDALVGDTDALAVVITGDGAVALAAALAMLRRAVG
jgi:hypothetical protein